MKPGAVAIKTWGTDIGKCQIIIYIIRCCGNYCRNSLNYVINSEVMRRLSHFFTFAVNIKLFS